LHPACLFSLKRSSLAKVIHTTGSFIPLRHISIPSLTASLNIGEIDVPIVLSVAAKMSVETPVFALVTAYVASYRGFFIPWSFFSTAKISLSRHPEPTIQKELS
jgi:hypothetical protein